MQHAQAITASRSATLRVDAHAPTILGDERAVELRCARSGGCGQPACGKLLLTIRSASGVLPEGLTIARECPRQKSLICEFTLSNPYPSERPP